MRLIDAMYHYYGRGIGRCEHCPHFRRKIFDKTYYKCSVYGDSNATTTDWRPGWSACGLIDKPYPDKDQRIVRLIIATKEAEIPIDGQMMFGFDGSLSEYKAVKPDGGY